MIVELAAEELQVFSSQNSVVIRMKKWQNEFAQAGNVSACLFMFSF
ncbi:hypothetical protein V7087_13175 [Neobacillus niacini]